MKIPIGDYCGAVGLALLLSFCCCLNSRQASVKAAGVSWSQRSPSSASAAPSNTIILDCCALLIPSSNTNRKMVQIASTTIPVTTSQKATRWTAAEYLGRSNIIPTPTAMLATTLNDNSVKWGQNGSKSPERNLLTYVSIAAMVGWLIAGILAVRALLKSLCALKHERHHGAS